ncbi:MAG TPA: metalloregulator ArsR/SmtB family transcription factor [Thermoanaerobaculia bacterium]|nr:metalloregulator ArsR/SmtB family transcription factor [Thermoanaerobaculia bacterium]
MDLHNTGVHIFILMWPYASRCIITDMKPRKRHIDMTPEALELVASRFRVMGEPVRLRILQALESAGEMSIGDLTEALGLSQPNVSKHVRILVEAGLVARRQNGNTVYCTVCDDSVFALCDLVCSSLRDRISAQSAILERRPARRT